MIVTVAAATTTDLTGVGSNESVLVQNQGVNPVRIARGGADPTTGILVHPGIAILIPSDGTSVVKVHSVLGTDLTVVTMLHRDFGFYPFQLSA